MSSTQSTRSHLLPENRRLRHLKGIYLRNLTFTRPRGRTIDDSAIPQSPNKHDGLEPGPKLHHAASSESLRKLRRRSAANASTGFTPQARQLKLEKSIESRVADAFISIHTAPDEDPIYLSETIKRTTNFNFQFFDLSHHDPTISRSNYVVVKVWAKRQDWSLLLEESLQLSDLQFIGPIQDQHFPPNCLLFHLVDGVYSLDLASKAVPLKDAPPMFTSSYNALMKLVTLENSIQDALATRATLEDKISNLLTRNAITDLPLQQERTKEVVSAVAQQRRSLKAAEDKRDRLKASIAARKKAIAEGTKAQAQAEKDVEAAVSKLPSSYALISQTKSLIHGQRRRICEDLSTIFPITPVPMGPPLAFQILNLPLPNTEYDPSSNSAEEERLSAAMGHVTYLVHALQFYLGVPVPYPVKPFGSRSSIRDDITDIPGPLKEYPLYLRGGASAQARFDYGWYLLNKDIEGLCGALGLKVVDIRHTLPNMKYLLYVGSAGKDELPERKKGGVRGLLMGRVRQRLDGASDHGGSSVAGGGSRRGSADSEFIARQVEQIQKAIRESSVHAAVNGGGGGGERRGTNVSVAVTAHGVNQGIIEPEEETSILASPTKDPMVTLFDESQKLSLKTRGMREQHGKI